MRRVGLFALGRTSEAPNDSRYLVRSDRGAAGRGCGRGASHGDYGAVGFGHSTAMDSQRSLPQRLSAAHLAVGDAVALPRGLFGTNLVDVAYVPWRAVRSTALRLGPSVRAPVVLADSGEPVGLAVDQHLGRQTTRNPMCLEAPPLRAAANGFVWGYCMPPVTRKSGWMGLSDLVPDPTLDQLACGPAGEDFDRRFPQACGGHCDGRPLTGLRAATGTAVVTAREVYLRYAPGSTAFRYLVRGDVVRRLARSQDGHWTGVEVRRARWAGRHARGWVLATALSPVGR
jgi:hypothetical protein